MRKALCRPLLAAMLLLGGCDSEPKDLTACAELALEGFRPVATERAGRFQGKVHEETARCRGGDRAVAARGFPWVDWQNYWAAGDAATRGPQLFWRYGQLNPNRRGIQGALLDLTYQRTELTKFNLFDNSGTYPEYLRRRDAGGAEPRVWEAMRLPKGHPRYEAVGGDDRQLCQGELIRFRTLSGICNDIQNPIMGSTGQFFARNVEFEATFPDLGKNQAARNRHGDRLGLLKPDPQVISRKLFTRAQAHPEKCREGRGLAGGSAEGECDYKKAPFMNVLAAFWIQFMTHDWFSHMEEGRNSSEMMAMGCAEKTLSAREIAALGCRPGDRIDRAAIAEKGDPKSFVYKNEERPTRAYKTARNTVTAWWDASQMYGYDEISRRRVKRDPKDRARLLLVPARRGEPLGYLPLFESYDPIVPQWDGQEATAFPDNWTVGLSFFHNVFAREHNIFTDAFRKKAAGSPKDDSGLRNPARPEQAIRYKDVSEEELFEIARLVIAAEIAKIHTIEWTTQLLYNEPLYLAMKSNWSGLLDPGDELARTAVAKAAALFSRGDKAAEWYSIVASAEGILGMGSRACGGQPIFAKDERGLKEPACINGGTNHFGSPFNFPEEFITVYRLHAMVPDLIEVREWSKDPDAIRNKIPVVETFRGAATHAMRERGLASWALSLGRQRIGRLALQNHPQFLQNLAMPRLKSATGKIDVTALDIIRDREHGVPRFNEFRRQYGLKQLTSFDDFVDFRLAKNSSERKDQERLAATLREVYGQHRCDDSKTITDAQVNDDGSKITDCLGHPNGSTVDNIEDLDTVVGWLAEPVRPHGFAISETQFQVFILNASRRLFSDRFFTSSFRPEFYTRFGVDWVMNNGPVKMMETEPSNGHTVEVSPLKRVLLRAIPELKPELDHVANAFDPWARDRGDYYSLQWKPRKGAEADDAFKAAKR